MTKSKALKILNEYYQKNGNITLYYLYDWYEKEFDYYNELVTNKDCNKSTEDMSDENLKELFTKIIVNCVGLLTIKDLKTEQLWQEKKNNYYWLTSVQGCCMG